MVGASDEKKKVSTKMVEAAKSRFDSFRSADVMGVRRYIEAGDQILLVKRTDMSKSKNTEKLKSNPTLEKTVVEFKVIKTQLPDGMVYDVDEAGKKKLTVTDTLGTFEPLRLNESCSLTEVSSSQGYFGNVLAFTAGVLGLTIDEMKADAQFDVFFDGAYGPLQIFSSMLVRCIAQRVKTKPGADGKPGVYTAKTWEAVPWSEYAEYGLVAPDGSFDPDNNRPVDEPAAESAAA